jgi:hypothetical protein
MAGERPPVRSWRRRRIVAPVLLVALVAAAWFGRPVYDGVFDFVRDNTADPKPARPTAATASSEAPGMPAAAAFNGANNQAWAPAGPGPGAELVAVYDAPVRLVNVIVTPGFSTKTEEFVAHGRPKKLILRFVGADDKESREEVGLVDRPGPQTFKLSPKGDVREVHILIESVYGPPDRPPAIAEVEFFRVG